MSKKMLLNILLTLSFVGGIIVGIWGSYIVVLRPVISDYNEIVNANDDDYHYYSYEFHNMDIDKPDYGFLSVTESYQDTQFDVFYRLESGYLDVGFYDFDRVDKFYNFVYDPATNQLKMRIANVTEDNISTEFYVCDANKVDYMGYY